MFLSLKVGVVGFGIMGQGIALVSLINGHSVVVKSSNFEKLLGQKDSFLHLLKKHVKRNPELNLELEKLTQSIKFVDTYDFFNDIDIVLESVNEDYSKKIEILNDLSKVVPESTVLASNTSSLSITKLSSSVSRPENFIGIHFMNPVPTMTLVEVIKGLKTSANTYKKSVEFVSTLQKKSISVGDFPGFVLNRVLIPMINEAAFLLYEGVASADDIDEALKLGANHPMGPLALADLIGLDTCLAIMNTLSEQLGDSKYRACPLLVNYVSAGWLGRKANKGFYDYGTTGRPATWPLKLV